MKVRHNKIISSGKWWRVVRKTAPKAKVKPIAWVDGKFIYA